MRAVETYSLCNEDIKDGLIESTLTIESSVNRKRIENLINQLLRRVVVQVGGDVRFEPSFFLCLLNFHCHLKLVKLKGNR